MITTTEINKLRELQSARNIAAEDLRRVSRLLQDYANKTARTAAIVETGDQDCPAGKFPAGGNEVFYAINEIENCLRNLNLRSLAEYACRLRIAELDAKINIHAKIES